MHKNISTSASLFFNSNKQATQNNSNQMSTKYSLINQNFWNIHNVNSNWNNQNEVLNLSNGSHFYKNFQQTNPDLYTKYTKPNYKYHSECNNIINESLIKDSKDCKQSSIVEHKLFQPWLDCDKPKSFSNILPNFSEFHRSYDYSNILTCKKRCHRCQCPNCINQHKYIDSTDETSGSIKYKKNKQHICHHEGCGKIYGKTSHLKAHLRWHNGERPFICLWTNCGRSFTRSDELQRHIRTHTGEKRFQCKTCGKAFTRSDHLSKHLKTHSE